MAMLKEARIRDDEKSNKNARKQQRYETLMKAVKESQYLNNLNKKLTQYLTHAWREEAEDRVEPNKEEIIIEFNTLELTSDIVHPSIKVEVIFAKNYPVTSYINDSKNYEF